MGRLSGQLSALIISGAIKQVSQMVAMAELVRQRQRQQQSSSESATTDGARTVAADRSESVAATTSNNRLAADSDCCPLCEGCGRISVRRRPPEMATDLLGRLGQRRPDILASLVQAAARTQLVGGPISGGGGGGGGDRNEQLERILEAQYEKLQRQLERISQQQVGLQFQLTASSQLRRRPDVVVVPKEEPLFSSSVGGHILELRRSSSDGTAVIQAQASAAAASKTRRARPREQQQGGARKTLSSSALLGNCSAAFGTTSATASALATGSGPLSSNIQQLKRMDTMKRRRLKEGETTAANLSGAPSKVSTSASASRTDQMSAGGGQPELAPEADQSSELLEEDEFEEEDDDDGQSSAPPAATTTNTTTMTRENCGGGGGAHDQRRGSKVNTGNGIDGSHHENNISNNDGDGRPANANANCAERPGRDDGGVRVAPPGGASHQTQAGFSTNSAIGGQVVANIERTLAAVDSAGSDQPEEREPRKRGQSLLAALKSSFSSSAPKQSTSNREEMSQQRQQREANKSPPRRSRAGGSGSGSGSGTGTGCSCLRASDSSQSFNYMK